MNMNYLEENLKDLGLVIDNGQEFENFILNYNGGLTAFFENLNVKKRLLERKFDYNYYENEIITFLKDIQKYLSEDENLKKSRGYLKEQYNVIIKNIINKNIIGLKIEQAKKLSDKLLNQLLELDLKISNLENNTTLDEKEKTVKLIDINIEKDNIESQYQDALNIIENERTIREKMQNRDFNQLIDELLKDISDLNMVISKLELVDSTRKIVSVIVNSYSNKFSKLQINKKRVEKEYNELLKKASLKSADSVMYEKAVEKEHATEFMKNDEFTDRREEYVSVDDDIDSKTLSAEYSDLEDIQVNEEEIVDDLTDINSLIGTNVVYTGKILLDDKIGLDELVKGKAFKVVSISKNDNGEDMVELEGLTGKYPLLCFETEEIWNNYLDEIEEYKVTSVIQNELDKIDLSINAIAGLITNAKVLKPVKKYGINTLIEKTNGISKKNLPIFKKITEIIDERKSVDIEQELRDYNPNEPLVNADEFAQEYEEIESSLKR